MSTGWDDYEPAPLEFFHGRLMDLFHEWRKSKTEETTVEINGNTFNGLIAKAKKATYKKYPKQVSRQSLSKNEV